MILGGRHVELGFAIHAKKHVYIVGPSENVFCALPCLIRFDTFDRLKAVIGGCEEREVMMKKITVKWDDEIPTVEAMYCAGVAVDKSRRNRKGKGARYPVYRCTAGVVYAHILYKKKCDEIIVTKENSV